MGLFDDRPVMIVAEQKGRDTKQKLFRNFGMPKPEGYRKALRAMQMAAKFGRPIVTLLDTPGAYPGIDAEERGQAEAIARNLREMARLPVPVIVVCIGEGGSGGALALGVGNIVLMLENAVYSVISPESCAAIIYRDSGKAEQAAAALRLTAEDLLGLGLIDGIVPEPPGGAQEDPRCRRREPPRSTPRRLDELDALADLVERRYPSSARWGISSPRALPLDAPFSARSLLTPRPASGDSASVRIPFSKTSAETRGVPHLFALPASQLSAVNAPSVAPSAAIGHWTSANHPLSSSVHI